MTCSKDTVASVGSELALSEKVAALSFTGSTATGKVSTLYHNASPKYMEHLSCISYFSVVTHEPVC